MEQKVKVLTILSTPTGTQSYSYVQQTTRRNDGKLQGQVRRQAQHTAFGWTCQPPDRR